VNNKVLIVEDQFVEANDLQLMLKKAGYEVCGIARSVDIAEDMIGKEKPDLEKIILLLFIYPLIQMKKYYRKLSQHSLTVLL